MARPQRISKIVVDRELCVGAAPCVTIMPDVFRLDAENKAVVVPGSEPRWVDVDTVLLAAKSCPVRAISVYDENGELVYPET